MKKLLTFIIGAAGIFGAMALGFDNGSPKNPGIQDRGDKPIPSNVALKKMPSKVAYEGDGYAISINTDKITVAPGETFQLEWTIEPEGTDQTMRIE